MQARPILPEWRALPDAAATEALAAALAAKARIGDVIALWGPLGAGKTTFARGFIRALGGDEEVPSPTFTLVQTYDLSPPVWHFDLYRIAAPEQVWELGVEEALAEGVSLIEWPERLGALLPDDRLDVRLEFAAGGRRARLHAHGCWAGRDV